jgi:glycosyltransferase involved in cell wall biosynthesis
LLALHQADLIHVHFGYPAADVLSAARRRPFVLSLHGHDITGRLRDEPGRYAAVVRAVDAVIVPSRFLADVTAAAGFPAERLRIIPSGVDTGFFDPTPAPAGPPVVGFVGRLVEKKGIDVLLAAWPRVLDAVPSARLTVLGDGPLRTLLTEVDDSVTWTRPDPTRRRDQVRDAIRASTVVATPSRTAADGDSESLLLVNLEAAASARPVVSTTHGGIPEYVEAGRTGLLVPEADPAALADALVRVLTDRDLAGRLATSGRDLVMQWDVRAMTSRVDSVYEDLLAGAP